MSRNMSEERREAVNSFSGDCTVDTEIWFQPRCGSDNAVFVCEDSSKKSNSFQWNAELIDSIIFNSYVGGACVFEWDGSAIRMLRANDNYAVTVLGEGRSVDDALSLVWEEHMDDAAAQATKNAILQTIRMGSEVTYEAAEQLKTVMANISGGVCAAVYGADGGIRIIFANDYFYSMYGYTREQFEAELHDGLDAVHPEDKERVRSIVSEMASGKVADSYDYRSYKRDGSVIYVRCRNSVIALSGISDTVILTITTDITESTVAEMKLRETDEQLVFLNETAHALLSRSDVNDGIGVVLKNTLDYFNGARAYLFELDYERSTLSNTYEICADGVSCEKDNLQNIPFSATPFWFTAFEQTGFVGIEDVDLLDSSRAEEKRLLQEQNIKSLVAVPLMRDNKLIGFLGVDDAHRHHSHIGHLKAIGDYLVASIARRNLNAKIESDKRNLANLMNDTPGGFARIRVRRNGMLSTEYVNETLCRFRGMTYEEIMAADSENITDTIHPDDREIVYSAVKEMLKTGGTRNIKYRLLCAHGEYVPFNVFGRVTRNEEGERFINAYYATLSEQEKKDLSVRETMPFVLSAIMSASTDLTFAKDKDFRYICCSPAFARFAGQMEESGVVGKTDFELFPEETAKQFRSDDEKLFSDGKSLVDYVEPIPSEDGMQHYANTSKYILRDTTGMIIGLYGIARDITEYRTAFEHLKLVTDNIPGGIASYISTPEGIKLTYFNDGYCNMMGYTHDEYEKICRNGITTLTFKEDIPALMERIHTLNKYNVPINYTYRVHNRYDDGFKWVNLRASVSERRGDIVYVNTMLFDVTEAKLAEEAMRIHDEEIKLVLSEMDRMISEYNIETRTLTMPDIYAEKYNIPQTVADAPEGMGKLGIMDEKNFAVYCDFYNAVAGGKKPAPVELRKHCGDIVRWERLTAFTIFSETGEPVKALVVSDDTTKQHLEYEIERNRPTLGEENMLFHALFNLTAKETLEYFDRNEMPVPPEEQLVFLGGKKAFEYVISDKDERDRFRSLHNVDMLLEAFAQGVTEFSMDYRRRMPGGEIIWVRNILHTMRKPGNDDVLLFEYCYNIEDEKIRELMYGALVSSSYDYVARINGRTRAFTVIANEDVKFGMPPEGGAEIDEAAKEIAEKFVHPDDREATIRNTSLEGIKKNLESRDKYQFTCRVIRPDGSVRYKKLTQYYLDRALEIIIVTREDITQIMEEENKKSEVLASALDAANQASRAKTQFLSRMSHELRTPMNAIIGLAALSATDINNPRVMEDNIAKIGMSARYLLSLINDILEMSRIESGRMTLSEAPFDFEEFVTNLNSIIYSQASIKGVDYDVIVNSYMEPSYVGDSTKLQEILVNVLGNAVKFTPAGGKVTLVMEQLRCVNKRVTLRFVINDTGIGIESRFIPHLFEPFSQESTNLTSTSTGIGLGLAITKNLVEMMDGHINVQSVKSVGSVFTIDVQLGVSEQSQQYLDLLASMNLSKLKALVVDDDVIVCRSTESVLRTMGVQAEWVDSGLRAVERVKEEHEKKLDFDTIFVDWKMPDMDGIETTRQIRSVVGPDVTIIIITAYDWHNIELEAREAGADIFMEKPLFQSSIVKAFEKIFLSSKTKIEVVPTAKYDFSGKRILLAEDNALNVEIARRLLERYGAEVISVSNGLEAMETYTTSEDGWFDLILMDIRMPVMDGLTATKNIRNLKKNGSRSIPIVAMTANAFDEDVELSLSSGMDAHLAKPIEPQVMYSTLQRLLRRSNG